MQVHSETLAEIRADIGRAIASLEQVMVGKADVVRLLFACILAGGHCLIEDVPGVGKTLLARTAAAVFHGQFRRIQFTPDLFPSDVMGVSIYHPESRQFEFRPGPIFGHVVLADEINRASPRTQSALLEAMEEGTVTVEGATHPLPRPFLVMATQNPVEFEATFPLPEAQLDRFLMRIHIGYPTPDEEMELLRRSGLRAGPSRDSSALSVSDLLACQAAVDEVRVDPVLRAYIVRIVGATREHPSLRLGASPRASLGLQRAAQAVALMAGREFVIPDDILATVLPVLSHRMVLGTEARTRGQSAEMVLREILDSTQVPGMPVPGDGQV